MKTWVCVPRVSQTPRLRSQHKTLEWRFDELTYTRQQLQYCCADRIVEITSSVLHMDVRSCLPQCWVFRTEYCDVALTIFEDGSVGVQSPYSARPDVYVEWIDEYLTRILYEPHSRSALPALERPTVWILTERGKVGYRHLAECFGLLPCDARPIDDGEYPDDEFS